jgi:hypothetical protein
VTDQTDVERQMRPEPPQNLMMRSGAATGADSSSSPTDMVLASSVRTNGNSALETAEMEV